MRNENVDELCRLCRTMPSAPKPTEEDRQFWLEPYADKTFSRPACSMEWIVETAMMIWGDD